MERLLDVSALKSKLHINIGKPAQQNLGVSVVKDTKCLLLYHKALCRDGLKYILASWKLGQ